MNALLLALDGRMELLKAIFGDGKKEEEGKRGITPAIFRAFRDSVNRRYAPKRSGRRGE